MGYDPYRAEANSMLRQLALTALLGVLAILVIGLAQLVGWPLAVTSGVGVYLIACVAVVVTVRRRNRRRGQ